MLEKSFIASLLENVRLGYHQNYTKEIYQTCTSSSSRGRGHLSTSIALFNVAYQQKNEQVSLLLLPAIDKRILTNAIEMAKDSTHH